MADNALHRKLLIKSGVQLLLLNAPPGYCEGLEPLPDGAHVDEDVRQSAYDIVHLFVHGRAELDARAPAALQSVKPRGVLWISYPKKSSKVKSDLTRDIGWEVVARAGWRGVAQVSIDETWSATRFRPAAEVGT